MSWTVACFCGNVYTAPPNGCEVCGCSMEAATPGTPEARSPTFAHTPRMPVNVDTSANDLQTMVGDKTAAIGG
jgi:hypothetical protein